MVHTVLPYRAGVEGKGRGRTGARERPGGRARDGSSTSPIPAPSSRALFAQGRHDSAFARDFRARCLDAQRRRDRLPLERAVHQGQLPAGLDPTAETDLLVGPLHYRVPVTGEPVGPACTDGLVDAFLRRYGLTPPDAGTAAD
ncbi:TetR-like C-terminal domain-containing protein [Streptomyces sp. NPDC096310]|uniref:TetR-like C-terminal domain-containing protein n=1 Tax=Streptomyces sp. NPDC096310 TaxID=3366082 RepID=UPI0037FBBB4A